MSYADMDQDPTNEFGDDRRTGRKAKPEFANAQEYWDHHSPNYPHQTTRPIGEPRPEVWREVVNPPDKYIVCPFDGEAHWAFTSQAELDRFNHTFPDPRPSTKGETL